MVSAVWEHIVPAHGVDMVQNGGSPGVLLLLSVFLMLQKNDAE